MMFRIYKLTSCLYSLHYRGDRQAPLTRRELDEALAGLRLDEKDLKEIEESGLWGTEEADCHVAALLAMTGRADNE